MRPMAVLTTLAAFFLAFTGCSLALSLDDLGGGGGAEIDGATDASGPAREEAGTAVDPPGPDGGASGDAAATLCPRDAVFCDDFERAPGDVRGAWITTREEPGKLALVDDGARASRALEVSLAARSDVSAGYAALYSLRNDVGGAPRLAKARFAYRLQIPRASLVRHYEAMEIELRQSSTRSTNLFLVVDDDKVSLAESTFEGGRRGLVFHAVGGLLDGAWHEVVLDVDTTTSPPHLRFAVDGKASLDAPADTPIQAGTVDFAAGITWAQQPWKDLAFRVDDLVVSGSP